MSNLEEVKNPNPYIVQMKLYKGKEAYNKEGKLISESQPMKLRHGVKEWTLFMDAVKGMGVSRVEIMHVTKEVIYKGDEPNTYAVVDSVPQNIQRDIDQCLKGAPKKLTPEQQEIADLKASIKEMKAAIQGGNQVKQAPPVKAEPVPVEEVGSVEGTPVKADPEKAELNAAKAKYAELFGEKPHHATKLASLNQKINAKLQENN